MDHHVVQRTQHGVGLIGHVECLDADRRRQRAEIGHVAVLGRVGTLAVARVDRQGAPDVGGHRRRSFDQRRRERRHRLVEQRHLGEVEQRQRGVGGVAGDETVDDGDTELVDGRGGVVGEHLQRSVVPPGARLDLGAGDESIGVRGERARHLVGRHEAGVEAEQVEPLDTGAGEPVASADWSSARSSKFSALSSGPTPGHDAPWSLMITA